MIPVPAVAQSFVWWMVEQTLGKTTSRIDSSFENLLFSLLFFISISAGHGKVSHFVRILASSDNSKVVSELLLLQISLGQVLQLTLGEAKIGRAGNSQLSSITGDGNIVGSKSSGLSIDLDSVVKVLLEHGNVEDLIVDRLRAVDDEFGDGFLSLDLVFRIKI